MSRIDQVSVFLDSSVLFSACYSDKGAARDLMLSAPTSRLRLVAIQHVILETRKNLARQQFQEILDSYLAHHVSLVDDPTEKTVRVVSGLIVVKDVPIVAGAIDSQSSFIATYDRRHLISMQIQIETQWGIRVATPSEILRELLPD